jgi:hypothetical protein
MNVDLVKPSLSGAIGTTCMTIFSVVSSEKKNRQFREHEILAKLLEVFPIDKTNRVALAWLGHFGMGMGFNTINQALLKSINKRPTFLNGLLLGAANGLVGIAVWKAIFALHPSPPKINLNRYLAHLMLAHLVFAAFSNISMKGITKNTTRAMV